LHKSTIHPFEKYTLVVKLRKQIGKNSETQQAQLFSTLITIRTIINIRAPNQNIRMMSALPLQE